MSKFYWTLIWYTITVMLLVTMVVTFVQFNFIISFASAIAIIGMVWAKRFVPGVADAQAKEIPQSN